MSDYNKNIYKGFETREREEAEEYYLLDNHRERDRQINRSSTKKGLHNPILMHRFVVV
jgi:hypothetical protein